MTILDYLLSVAAITDVAGASTAVLWIPTAFSDSASVIQVHFKD